MAANDEGLTDSDVGMIDAIKTMMELVLSLGVPPSALAEPLEFRRNGHRAAGRVNAAVVLEVLRAYVVDPERARQRQAVRTFQQEPPRGSA